MDKPTPFELYGVLDVVSADSEELTRAHQSLRGCASITALGSHAATMGFADLASNPPVRIMDDEEPDGQAIFPESSSESWVVLLRSNEWLAADAMHVFEQYTLAPADSYPLYSVPIRYYLGGRYTSHPALSRNTEARLGRVNAVKFQRGEDGRITMNRRDGQYAALPVLAFPFDSVLGKDMAEWILELASQLKCTCTPLAEIDSACSVEDAYHLLSEARALDRANEHRYAEGLILAWHSIMKSVVAWERAPTRQSLRDLFSLPPVIAKGPPERDDHDRLSHDELVVALKREKMRVEGLQTLHSLDTEALSQIKQDLVAIRKDRDHIHLELDRLRNTKFWRLIQWVHRFTGA